MTSGVTLTSSLFLVVFLPGLRPFAVETNGAPGLFLGGLFPWPPGGRMPQAAGRECGQSFALSSDVSPRVPLSGPPPSAEGWRGAWAFLYLPEHRACTWARGRLYSLPLFKKEKACSGLLPIFFCQIVFFLLILGASLHFRCVPPHARLASSLASWGLRPPTAWVQVLPRPDGVQGLPWFWPSPLCAW